MNCPYCNKPLTVHITGAQRAPAPGWIRRPASHVMHNATADALHQSNLTDVNQAALFDEFFRQRPARTASIVSDVVVPTLQSLLLSLATVPPAVVALQIGDNLINEFLAWLDVAADVHFDWTLALWGASGIFCYQLYKLFGDHNNALWDTEEGKRERPAAQSPATQPDKPEEIIYEVHPETGTIKRGRLNGVTDDELHLIAAGALAGKPLSEGEWSPLKEGKPFSAARFRQIMSRLDDEGFTQLKDPKAPTLGREPTGLGVWFFKSVEGVKS